MPLFVDSQHGISVPIGAGGLGHKFEMAPDGQRYFAVLGPSIHLVRALGYIEEARLSYLSYANGMGRQQALALELLSREVQTAVGETGVLTADFAEKKAKSLLEKRIVRPRTPKPDHLIDAIVARVIPSQFLGGGGAVGIGDIGMLDAHPGWKAIEFGSTHLVGKELRGFFLDGGGGRFPADPSMNRAHPVFSVGGGPRMIVRNPIEGKSFLTEASLEALGYRARLWRGIERGSVAQLRSIAIGTAIPRGLAGRRPSEIIRRAPRLP